MEYFHIEGVDFSQYVNEFKITRNANYNALVNAAGNTVVDIINFKRTFEVGIIPLDDAAMQDLLNMINLFDLNISFRNPETGTLEEDVSCIIPSNGGVEYYTIQANKVLYKALKLTFIEL